jgi:hypothetical protein
MRPRDLSSQESGSSPEECSLKELSSSEEK